MLTASKPQRQQLYCVQGPNYYVKLVNKKLRLQVYVFGEYHGQVSKCDVVKCTGKEDVEIIHISEFLAKSFTGNIPSKSTTKKQSDLIHFFLEVPYLVPVFSSSPSPFHAIHRIYTKFEHCFASSEVVEKFPLQQYEMKKGQLALEKQKSCHEQYPRVLFHSADVRKAFQSIMHCKAKKISSSSAIGTVLMTQKDVSFFCDLLFLHAYVFKFHLRWNEIYKEMKAKPMEGTAETKTERINFSTATLLRHELATEHLTNLLYRPTRRPGHRVSSVPAVFGPRTSTEGDLTDESPFWNTNSCINLFVALSQNLAPNSITGIKMCRPLSSSSSSSSKQTTATAACVINMVEPRISMAPFNLDEKVPNRYTVPLKSVSLSKFSTVCNKFQADLKQKKFVFQYIRIIVDSLLVDGTTGLPVDQPPKFIELSHATFKKSLEAELGLVINTPSNWSYHPVSTQGLKKQLEEDKAITSNCTLSINMLWCHNQYIPPDNFVSRFVMTDITPEMLEEGIFKLLKVNKQLENITKIPDARGSIRRQMQNRLSQEVDRTNENMFLFDIAKSRADLSLLSMLETYISTLLLEEKSAQLRKTDPETSTNEYKKSVKQFRAFIQASKDIYNITLYSFAYVMDMYALGRLFRDFAEKEQKSAGKSKTFRSIHNSVFYTGRGHSEGYVYVLRQNGFTIVESQDTGDAHCLTGMSLLEFPPVD